VLVVRLLTQKLRLALKQLLEVALKFATHHHLLHPKILASARVAFTTLNATTKCNHRVSLYQSDLEVCSLALDLNVMDVSAYELAHTFLLLSRFLR
jgi:hypothetical protein